MFREWETEVDARIDAIRAERTGEGVGLTPQQARALAGEWYEWFIRRHPLWNLTSWEHLQDRAYEALREAVGYDEWDRSNPDDLWWQHEDLRREVRPVLADIGETAQFLAVKKLTLNDKARDRFLDWLYEDLGMALRRLIRAAQGDYSDDGYAKRFPKFEGSDTGQTPQQLFEAWVVERKPARSSVESWRYVFAEMAQHFKERSATSITPDEAQGWMKSLTGKRSASTVRKNWITASKTVFGWACEHKLIAHNPFAQVKITVPKKHRLRETQAFLPDEWRTILRASFATTELDSPNDAARRWVPWLCAYTGARAGEMTQLRGNDVIDRDGIPGLRITPEAGTVKNKQTRVVPIHEHLIEQGFLAFVKKHGPGPIFYRTAKQDGAADPLKAKKTRYEQARQRLAAWVRSVGVSDPELLPNHAWRHTFKQIADRAGISERMSDYITGHAHKNVGATYGAPTLADMAEALKKFPRYSIEQPQRERLWATKRASDDVPMRPLTSEQAYSLRRAPMAALDARPRTESAVGLSARLAAHLTNWETTFSERKNQRKGRHEKLQAAIGAFVADLLGACNDRDANGWTWRSLNKAASRDTWSRSGTSTRS
jgi:integrase